MNTIKKLQNAKEELEKMIISTNSKIKCAHIKYERNCLGEDKRAIILKQDYSDEEYLNFLEEMNFDYDSGFGGQRLFGIVWLGEETWLERAEYDGSEWWEYRRCPVITDEMIKNEKDKWLSRMSNDELKSQVLKLYYLINSESQMHEAEDRIDYENALIEAKKRRLNIQVTINL